MQNITAFFTLLLVICAFALNAQSAPKDTINRRVYTTARIQGESPTVDAVFDEPVWEQVEWATGFTENRPDNNAPAVQETAFKILYDEKFLYVAYRCFDSEPDSIVSRMSRRDGFEGDFVEINIDSYRDLQSGFSFTSTVAGVKGDESISNQFNWDDSWNPIWYMKSRITEEGWAAEVKIPFSQLRFSAKEEQIWGFQINRHHFRDGSRSAFQHIPNDAPYWVRGFAELHGIRGIQPQKQVEIQPYVVAKASSYPAEPGNPFADGSDVGLTGGVDGKIGITNNTILDFTVNPDFGQVEADPSQLVLDGFEVFFQERRPFFVEGSGIFNFRITNFDAFGSFNRDRLFYSRRIGGSPKGFPSLRQGEYFTAPDNSTILGAAKLSGRTQKGTSFGILESITQEERAVIDLNGERREEVIEPLTSYFVGRVKQDMNDNNTTVGGSLNAVNRRLNGTGMENWLTDQAYTGGVDFTHAWNDQTWRAEGSLTFSQVLGSQQAITRKQTDFLHGFDAPDAEHLSVDTSATSLFGHAGTAKIAKYGGKLRFSTGVTWRSPGLDLNDIGFMTNTDQITTGTWVGYQILEPKGIVNRGGFNLNHVLTHDFSGKYLYQMLNHNSWFQFKNFWNFNYNVGVELKDISRRALFGGPSLNRPRGWNTGFGIFTDQRKKFSMGTFAGYGGGFEDSVHGGQVGMDFILQPLNALRISLSPSYGWFYRQYLFLPYTKINDGTRYVGGRIDQETFSLTARLNYNITPDLTIQYYGSPFISHGVYSDFKYITDAGAEHEDRYERYGDAAVYDAENDRYFIDANRDGVQDCPNCEFGNPDFSFIQFRSNLVSRWEYVPGSELFLVWSQGTTNFGDPQGALLPTLSDKLFGEQGNNVFLVKWTYRFIL